MGICHNDYRGVSFVVSSSYLLSLNYKFCPSYMPNGCLNLRTEQLVMFDRAVMAYTEIRVLQLQHAILQRSSDSEI